MDKKFSNKMRHYFEQHGFVNTGLGSGSHTVYAYDGENSEEPIKITLPNSIAYWKQQTYKSSYVRKLREAGASDQMISDLRRIPLGLEEDDIIELEDLEKSLYKALSARDVIAVAKCLLKISKTMNKEDLLKYSCPPLEKYIDETDEAEVKWKTIREIRDLLERIFVCALKQHIAEVGMATVSARRISKNEYPEFNEEISKQFGMKITGVDLDHPGAEFELSGEFTDKLADIFVNVSGAHKFHITLSNDSGDDEEFFSDTSGIYGFTVTINNQSIEQLRHIKKEIEQYLIMLALKGYDL